MASPQKTYLNQMHKKFGYRANWEPHRKIAVGMIGKLRRGEFINYGTLEEEGIPVKINSQGGDGKLDFTSEGGVTIETKLAGKAVPPSSAKLGEADAGVVISFGSTNSTVFKALNSTNHTLANLKEVETEFIRLVNQGKLDKEYAIITEIVEAGSATIIVSNSANAKIEIKANAEAQVQEIDIADASLELSAVAERNIETKVIARSSTQVLFKVMKVKTKFLSSEAIGLKIGSRNELLGQETLLEEVPFDETELE